MMYLIGDCHGNAEGLNRAMTKAGLIDNHGKRTTMEDIFSIGDLANCVRDSVKGDLDCLSFVTNEYIDGIIIGNHEGPYLSPQIPKFSGFWWDSDVDDVMQDFAKEEKFLPGLLVDGVLVTHAGLSASKLVNKHDDPEWIMDLLEEAWDTSNWHHSWLYDIGQARGGNASCGGVWWCDFDDEFIPTEFPQICGHTPRGVRMKGNALCIDVGAKDQDTEPFILRLV
jgi:hypothetical protein